MDSSESQLCSNKDAVLKITVHSCENLKLNALLLQPTLRMHVIDEKTGTYVKKSDRNRAVVSFYENERNDVDYIMPVMTQPCSITGERLTDLKWEEELILNEPFDVFVEKNSNIILIFEIIDLISVSFKKQNYERLNYDGMRKLAWAFLKIQGHNGVINTGRKLHLQLYKPCNTAKKKKKSYAEVYSWWLKKPRTLLESSLLISVEPYIISNVEPALRSMLPIQQEKGSTSFEKLSGFDKESLLNSTEKSNSISNEGRCNEVIWSRKVGEPCKIPMNRTLLLDVVNCCQTLKFSSSGRVLAAGCGTQGCFYLLFYQIPQGNLINKVLAHSEPIYELDWSHNDCYILSASGDYYVKMWSANCGSLVGTFMHPSFVYSAKFHPKVENLFASACYDHIIRIWSLEKCQLLKELEGHNSTVCSLCWNVSGTKLYSVDGIGQIKVWRKKKQVSRDAYQLEKEINPQETKGISINKIVLDPNEESLCLFCWDSVTRILDLVNGNISSLESDVSSPTFSKGCCSPCSTLIFVSNEKGNISVWNRKLCKGSPENVSYNLNYGSISCIEYHPHEHMLALSFWNDGVPIHIYSDNENGEEKCEAVLDISSVKVSDSNEFLDNLNKSIIRSGSGPIDKKNSNVSGRNRSDSRAESETANNAKATFETFSNKCHKTGISPSGSSDILKFESFRKELRTAVTTNKEHFDGVAVEENSAFSDTNTFASSGNNPVITNKSTKRSERRKKLREMNKIVL